MAGVQTYSGLNPRTQLYAYEQFLERAQPYLCIEKFMSSKPVPTNSSKTISLRRYESLPNALKVIVEGITPAPSDLTFTDYSATLVQYGDHAIISDVVEMTHEDDVFGETVGLMGEQAAQMMEKMRWGIMTGGSNVQYATSGGRTAVVDIIGDSLMTKVLRTLKRYDARYLTKALAASPNYATAPIDRAYIAIGHVDLENDIRGLTNFLPREKYTSMTPFDGEIGSWRNIRFILGTIYSPFADAGGATGAGTTRVSTSGSKCDVYPLMVFGKDFFSGVCLKGKAAVQVNGKKAEITESDPFAQRNVVSWKTMQTALITNDFWGVRVEAAATL
jgi:N4-gp56 family major capsid protein